MHSPFPHTALTQTTTPLLAAQGMIGRCWWTCARLGAFFYWTRCLENNVPLDNTTPIYLINLLWKLGLRFGSDSELHYFSIFHGEERKSKVSTLSSANFANGNPRFCQHLIRRAFTSQALTRWRHLSTHPINRPATHLSTPEGWKA